MAATKYRNGWPVLDPLAGDPSMRKGRTDADLLDFNRRIYAPGGMTPQPSPPASPTPWKPAAGDYAFLNNPSGAPLSLPPDDPMAIQNMGGFPVAGAAGPTGPPALNPGQDSYAVAPASPTSPMSPGMPSPLPGTPAGIGAPPAQNAMQQHQVEAATPPGMRPISNARRFFWATGRVDGSAPLAAASQPTNFDATFGPGATHMGGPGVTWQQRQQQNQQHIADASAQRGLDFSPY